MHANKRQTLQSMAASIPVTLFLLHTYIRTHRYIHMYITTLSSPLSVFLLLFIAFAAVYFSFLTVSYIHYIAWRYFVNIHQSHHLIFLAEVSWKVTENYTS
uniref:Uncharacterized protein n=1 Tax=Trypanosoma vivax (strain Y486) TaxID=1055687 RepID=G0TRG4_TRYVY|nr:hypothetical protein, unlikely [Trypanosoma vivax Y486]